MSCKCLPCIPEFDHCALCVKIASSNPPEDVTKAMAVIQDHNADVVATNLNAIFQEKYRIAYLATRGYTPKEMDTIVQNARILIDRAALIQVIKPGGNEDEVAAAEKIISDYLSTTKLV